MTPPMNCLINNYSGPQPAPCGAVSSPVFLGVVLSVGHFQVCDAAMVVHQITYISGEGNVTWYRQCNYLMSCNALF